MSDVALQLVIGANSADAMRAIREVEDRLRGAGAQMRSVGQMGQQSGAQVAQGATLAAGAVGNLTAQFNDIGQMLMAGQNPLTLAVQQGTQIAQVLGPLGAGGAVRALGQAFLGMLNPISLITIGSIAVGAAMVQWLTSAGEKAGTAEDRLKGLADAVKALESAGEAASVPVERQIAAYGRLADAVQASLRAEFELARARASARLDAAVDAAALPGVRRDAATAGPDDAGSLEIDLVGLDLQKLAERWRISINGAASLAKAFDRLREARAAGDDAATAQSAAAALATLQQQFGGTLAEAPAQARELGAALAELTRGAADMARITGQAGAQGIEALGNAADRTRGKLDDLARAQLELATRGLSASDRAVAMAAAEFAAANPLPRDATPEQRARWEEASRAATSYARAVATVRAEIAALDAADRVQADIAAFQRRAEIAAIEARYGRESAEAVVARAAAEREALDASLRAEGVADDLRQQLLDAWQAAQGLSGVDLASPIAVARLEAQGLTAELAAAVGAAERAVRTAQDRLAEARVRAQTVGDPVGRATQLAALRFERENPLPAIATLPDGQRNAALRAWGESRARYIAAEREAAQIEQATLALERGLRGGGGGGGRASGDGLDQLQARARGAMEDVALAVAGIHEQVRAGLMTTAEGADAVEAAKRRAATALAELIPRIEAMGPAGQLSAEQLRAALAGMVAELGTANAGIRDALSNGFEDIIADFLKGTKTMGEAFAAFGDLVIATIARIAAERITQQFIMPMINPLIDGLFGLLPFARGGVVAGGSSGLGAYRDSVVDRPTLFPMRGGVGLMGEAGAEAILPLVGRGGVRALAPDGEMVLPLARAASGHLAVALPGSIRVSPDFANRVAAFARGGVPQGLLDVLPASMLRANAPRGTGSAAGTPPPARGTRVEVVLNGATGQERVTEERFADGDDDVIRMLVDLVDGALTENAARGRGQLTAALRQMFGPRRPGL
jgi:hypothetical protein